MGSVSFLLVVVIITALAFDFTNGFHDTANSMATSIATGALSPRVAVTVAGVLNLAGAFLSTEVAKTISNGIVDDGRVVPGDDLRGAGRGDPVESDHLARRAALQLVPRPVRRADRGGVGGGRGIRGAASPRSSRRS